jgi:hypothetical protein
VTLDDVTAPEPFEPQDSWAGGADEEPDDLDRRPYKQLGWPIAHPTGCRCAACATEAFGKERSNHASLGPTVVAATPGDSEKDRPTAPPPGNVRPPFVPGGGAGDGAVPALEIDDVETEPQCKRCLRAWADCNCPAKGNA